MTKTQTTITNGPEAELRHTALRYFCSHFHGGPPGGAAVKSPANVSEEEDSCARRKDSGLYMGGHLVSCFSPICLSRCDLVLPRPKSSPRPAQPHVPDNFSCDELQEIVSQAIWEWGINRKLVPREALELPEKCLTACFRAMAMGDGLDAGPNTSDGWLSQSAKAWYMDSAEQEAR